MQIGVDCFQDEQFRSMILTESRRGNCEIKSVKDCLVYDTEYDSYLEEYLEEIIDIFTATKYLNVEICEEKTGYLRQFLFKWEIFSVSEDEIQRIVVGICAERYREEPEIFEERIIVREFTVPEIMSRECILKNYEWEEFCNHIKYKNRFHSSQINIDQLKKLIENMVTDIPKGALSLYRSRICDEDHYINGFAKEEMGMPDSQIAKAGRLNSVGAPCLYLSNNEETTYHEVRVRDFDRVSVGEFVQEQDLKIVDFNLFDNIGPFSIPDFDLTWFAINISIIRKIGEEVAKPMRRIDNELDYIPAQYICDYVKCLGYDGIRYKSTLMNAGINYAIFDERKFSCKEVKVVLIGKIKYEWASIL